MIHHVISICFARRVFRDVYFICASMVNFQWRQPRAAVTAWVRDADWLQAVEERRGEERRGEESNRVFYGVLWCGQCAPTWRAWAEKALAITYSCLEFTPCSGPGSLGSGYQRTRLCIPSCLRFSPNSFQLRLPPEIESGSSVLSEYHVGLCVHTLPLRLFLSLNRTISIGPIPNFTLFL